MTTGIIDGKPTVAYQLFHNLYPVRILNMHLVSGKEKQHRVGYTSDDPDIEAMTRFENTEVYRTPVGMTLLYDKGIVPYIVHRKDTYEIYNLIVQHLNNWAAEIKNPVSVLTPPPPVELLQLEQFSHSIYEAAMFERENIRAAERVNNHDNSLQNFIELFGGRTNLNSLQTVAKSDPAQLASIADAWDAITW